MKKILVILFWFISLILSATNYYVKNAGSDAANGLTDGTAWQTINKINISSFSAGDTIFFNKGDTWREILTVPSSGNAGAYIVFGSYGTGVAPAILGSTSAITWSDMTGNVWKSATSVTDPYLLPWDANIYFKETDGDISWGRVKKADTASLAVEYDWTWAANYIYVYAATDPDSRYSRIEVTQREPGIELNNKEYLTFDGLEVAYTGSAGISELWPAVNVSGLVVKNCHIHHIGIKTSSAGYGLTLWHSNMTIQNNNIHDCGRRNISLNIYEGTATVNNIIIEGNVLYHGFHTTGVDICTDGQGTLNNIIIRNNLIYDDVAETQCMGIISESTSTGSVNNLYIYNNIIINNNYCAILLLHTSSSYVYNNTIYGVNPDATEAYNAFLLIGPTTNCVVKNNIFYNNVISGINPTFSCTNVSSSAGTVVFDYNLFYCTDAAAKLVAWSGTSYTTAQWANYKIASGQDANSPTPANPYFVSSSDYHLLPASTVIDAGLNVGLLTDYEGNAWQIPPSIGAYEYGSIAPPVSYYILYNNKLIMNNGKLLRHTH